ncbi:hypothetical protein PFISCL1PPCAC_21465, partial [Pristionchus fissidentatus]
LHDVSAAIDDLEHHDLELSGMFSTSIASVVQRPQCCLSALTNKTMAEIRLIVPAINPIISQILIIAYNGELTVAGED